MAVDFDLLLPDIGEYGTYQKFLIWFVLLPGFFPCGFHAYNQLFLTTNYDHWCKVPELDGLNLTMEEVKNLSIPYQIQHGRPKYNQCHQFLRNYSEIAESLAAGGSLNDLVPETDVLRVPCSNGHQFQVNSGESSIISEWQIVCDLNFYPTLALVIFGASGLIGNWIFGYIQDGIGRRPAFFIYLVIQSVFGILTAIAPEFWSWVIFRVGVGFTVPAIMGTPFVLAIELVGPSWRTHVTLLANVVYSICLVLLSFVVWSVRDWRYMSLTTCLPFFIFFSYWWIMPESPRWLIARNRVEEAEIIIRRMAKWNKKDLSFEFYEKLRQKEDDPHSEEEVERVYGVLHLLKTPNLAKKFLIVTFIWFTVTSVYVGLSYYAPVLGGNEYLNFFLAGAAELPTYLLLFPTMNRWGRRWVLWASMIIGGAACLGTVLSEDDYVTTLVLYCIGKSGISSAFVVLPLFASELYPTVVRGIGLSISAVAGMLGPVFIPLVNYMGEEYISLPLIVMGSLMLIGGNCALLLPETLHQNLPQTLEDGEQFGKQFGFKDFWNCCPVKPSKSSAENSPGEVEELNDLLAAEKRKLHVDDADL
ncbi:beta-alanine transporter-like isoform X2 [Artemia franciscana]|uniref:Major facilitator superfamily (MFS) profile domain-containing protein n=1 Tax=Artemia franciscana TaxID=6661 RepID=A0AA88L7R6_ARTSF|nr:hypothetical protein QYM36_003711 [Artemia franciscana]KAK2721513.1 hypothetical protein QYM36_003711 [Artemia franciscana]